MYTSTYSGVKLNFRYSEDNWFYIGEAVNFFGLSNLKKAARYPQAKSGEDIFFIMKLLTNYKQDSEILKKSFKFKQAKSGFCLLCIFLSIKDHGEKITIEAGKLPQATNGRLVEQWARKIKKIMIDEDYNKYKGLLKIKELNKFFNKRRKGQSI